MINLFLLLKYGIFGSDPELHKIKRIRNTELFMTLFIHMIFLPKAHWFRKISSVLSIVCYYIIYYNILNTVGDILAGRSFT